MLEDYCNQKAIWKSKTGVNDCNESTYEEKEIDCRKEEKIKLVRDKTGKEVVSNTTVYTPEPICVDDMVDGRIVIGVGTMTDLDGVIEGYEVYLT